MKIRRKLPTGINSIESVFEFLTQPGALEINQRYRHIGVEIKSFNFDVIKYLKNCPRYLNGIEIVKDLERSGFLLIIYQHDLSRILIESRGKLTPWLTTMVYIKDESLLDNRYESVYNMQHPNKAVPIR